MGLNIGKNLVNQAYLNANVQKTQSDNKTEEKDVKTPEIQDKSGIVKASALEVLANQNKGAILVSNKVTVDGQPKEPLDPTGRGERNNHKVLDCAGLGEKIGDSELFLKLYEYFNKVLGGIDIEDFRIIYDCAAQVMIGEELKEGQIEKIVEIINNLDETKFDKEFFGDNIEKLDSQTSDENGDGNIAKKRAKSSGGGSRGTSWSAYFGKYMGVNTGGPKTTLERYEQLAYGADLDIGSNGMLDVIYAIIRASYDYKHGAAL